DRRPDRVCGLAEKVDGVDVVIDAVQEEVVLPIRTYAAGRETAVVGVACALFRWHNAGRQARQISKVALPTERDIGNRLRAERGANPCALCLEQRSSRGDLNGLADIADGQREVDRGTLTSLDNDVVLLSFPEAGRTDGNAVSGRLQGGADKLTGGVGGELILQA